MLEEKADPAVLNFLRRTRVGEMVFLAALGGGRGVEADPVGGGGRRGGRDPRGGVPFPLSLPWCVPPHFLFTLPSLLEAIVKLHAIIN